MNKSHSHQNQISLTTFFFLLKFLIGLISRRYDHELTDLLFTYISWIFIILFCMARNVVIPSVLQHLSAFFFSKVIWFSFTPTPCSSWCTVDPGDASTQPVPPIRSINPFQANEPTCLCFLFG